ncbi:MAG TPA: hypothetical protein VK489_02150 [Ferruginibacter sp.]|nr:hypothetical protein [Ferruginibacter sp.]
MKKQTTTFSPISKEEMKELTTVTPETLAKPRTFSSAELWNIQRRSRTMVSRRYA